MLPDNFFIEYGQKQEADDAGMAFALSDIIEEFNLTGIDTAKIRKILDYHGVSYGN